MAKTAAIETETLTPRKPRKAVGRPRKANGHSRAAKPRKAAAPAARDQFGFRTTSLKSRAAAMYASKKGATLAEVKAALKTTQFNLLTELEARKPKVEIERTQVEGEGPRKVTRYRIVT